MIGAPGFGAHRRVHTPTVLQMEVTECGPAALAIILAHFGRRVPLEQLRVACGVSRDGSKATSIVRAARGYGLLAKGWRLELDEVLAGPFPVIVHWSFNHFVVVEGASRRKVYLNDPAVGPRSVTHQEFADNFTGVVLKFEPGPDFTRGGTAAGLIARLGHRLTGFGTAVGFVAWISLMMVIPGLVLPGVTKTFVDDILVRHYDGWLGPLLVGLATMFVLQILLSGLQELALLRIELRLALEQSAQFTWHVLRLPIEFFSQRYTGDLANRIEANDRVAKLLARDCGRAAATCFTASFLGIVMLFYDTTLAAIAIGGAALNIVVLTLVRRVLSDVVLRLQTEVGKLYAVSVVGLESIETLKSTGTEGDFFAKWTGNHAQALNSEQRLAVYQQTSNLVPPLVSSLTAAAVLGVGALQVVDGTLSIGALVAFQSLLMSFSAPIAQMVGTATKVQQASADLARLDDVLHYRRDWRFPETPPPPVETFAAGHLSLSGVSFGYKPLDPPLIEDFSIDVAPGRWLALVGASGSGKSTLGKLITGIYEPRSGEVCIDGHTLAEWGRDQLAHIVSSVDQDIRLFQGTLRDNVTLWDETVSHRTLLAAITDAGLADVVKNLSGNLDGAIREGGRNLNGGQRQRIGIARALVQEPAVLVLDEATTALDSVSESEILDAVRRRGMTWFWSRITLARSALRRDHRARTRQDHRARDPRLDDGSGRSLCPADRGRGRGMNAPAPMIAVGGPADLAGLASPHRLARAARLYAVVLDKSGHPGTRHFLANLPEGAAVFALAAPGVSFLLHEQAGPSSLPLLCKAPPDAAAIDAWTTTLLSAPGQPHSNAQAVPLAAGGARACRRQPDRPQDRRLEAEAPSLCPAAGGARLLLCGACRPSQIRAELAGGSDAAIGTATLAAHPRRRWPGYWASCRRNACASPPR